MEFDKKIFGKNLRKYRNLKGLTAEKLGEMVLVEKSTISKYENGCSEPSLEMIMKLSEVLGITPNDLFTDRSGSYQIHPRTRQVA